MKQEKIYKVEKINKDDLFEYPIAKITQDYLNVKKEENIGENDFVIGIRPEFIKIHKDGKFSGEVYSSMPTGMETTIRINIGEYIITGVVFGNITLI